MPLALVLAEGPARLLGAVAFVDDGFAYQPTLRYHRRSALWALAMPLVASFYTARHDRFRLALLVGRGGQWKGGCRPPRQIDGKRGAPRAEHDRGRRRYRDTFGQACRATRISRSARP